MRSRRGQISSGDFAARKIVLQRDGAHGQLFRGHRSLRAGGSPPTLNPSLAPAVSDQISTIQQTRASEVAVTDGQTSPRLQLQTLFVTDAQRRIVWTREPHPARAPAFVIVRGEWECAWAIRADVAEPVALELNRCAAQEPPAAVWERPLLHADRYAALLGSPIRSGPAFAFPEELEPAGETFVIDNEADLSHHFSGWVAGEIDAGRGPVLAVRDGGHAVSVCFCARRSATAAEAGIETAAAFRGRGYAPRAAIAWARRVRAEGLTPLYSTDWSNRASLAVARKLKLVPFAADFSIGE